MTIRSIAGSMPAAIRAIESATESRRRGAVDEAAVANSPACSRRNWSRSAAIASASAPAARFRSITPSPAPTKGPSNADSRARSAGAICRDTAIPGLNGVQSAKRPEKSRAAVTSGAFSAYPSLVTLTIRPAPSTRAPPPGSLSPGKKAGRPMPSSTKAPGRLGTTRPIRPKNEAPTRLARSEEHTSELQSPCNLVCRLLLEKKKKEQKFNIVQKKKKKKKKQRQNQEQT